MKPIRYVIGDIHGADLALIQVLKRCGFRYDIDELITLGDIVDAGNGTYECIEELLKIPNRIDIVGNHDQWMYDFIMTGIHSDKWSQGGLATAQSYANARNMELLIQKHFTHSYLGRKITYTLNLIPEDIPESHHKFFKGQHTHYRDDDNNLFVHGGVNRYQLFKEQSADYMMWDRKLWNQALSAKSGKQKLKWYDDVNNVFIGHTSTIHWNTDKPMKADNVWNLDTGAGGTGKLTIMNIDTKEYWQSDLIKELYPKDDEYTWHN